MDFNNCIITKFLILIQNILINLLKNYLLMKFNAFLAKKIINLNYYINY